ncbi:membrane protein [Streptomyces spiroverticillatus]|uniref:Membrane protein n=2 Tax=Streptomyces finlayi TaxID=67296 RepID=A0A918WTJ1_9ACTN|nr:membrane protein [Streptomyces spiroverticillatus]GHC81781.1 membrane protein [Streptomyces finlayi]
MVKVPCDPAQVIVNHASFRVQLAPSQSARPTVVRGALDDRTAKIPALSGAGAAAVGAAAGAAAGRRRAPVVWTGRSEPGDPGAGGLLQAVRNSTATRPAGPADDLDAGLDAGATQLIPRIGPPEPAPDDTMQTPAVTGEPTRMLPRMRQAEGAYDAYEDQLPYDDEESEADGRGDGRSRHSFYPDRRMNLGVVLLPLRVFLGFISIYAGMGKLCDPVFFDGGERGSMVKWLNALHPWPLAEPLRDFALQHPVGAGLSVAFLQVVVGVLTVLGLWQRVAAVFGTLLSAALLLTVSWKSVPAYDAPDIIYLAAWSPLIIAGAPVYSMDSRLAGEAWRTLGPRSAVWELRRRVLRRGFLMVTLVVGLTLLVGSVLGGAVRSAEVVVPGPDDDPANHLPGRPLPKEPGAQRTSQGPQRKAPKPSASSSVSPSAKPSSTAGPRATATAGATAGPSRTRGSTGRTPTRNNPPASASSGPSATAGPSSSGGTGDGGSSSSGGSGSGGSSSGGSQGGNSGGGSGGDKVIGGLLG